LVYGGFINADLNICRFENFLIPLFSPKSYSKPLRNEKIQDLAAQLIQKQQQQQKQEGRISWSIDNHELQKMLAGSDR
jgi:23S rRNA A1618 N6-methylase RlmF